ncbi:right-handed parallel beta-helix repeat-containing protein [Streptomyces sp. NPDC046977]|uniref:right-handed parallel beta-helix repeat-containing protein n=1 Tax=Streptomyces sp. NPDC046977 TaxID=3154703 RepID=UPI0033F8E1C0
MKHPRSHRAVVVTATAAALAVGAVGCGNGSSGGTTSGSDMQKVSAHTVHPGESIQSAVDQAAPGDVIDIEAGIYNGSVQITTPRLTLRGAGTATVIMPSKTGKENACAKAGEGLCITGTAKKKVTDVRLESLTVTGFKTNGIHATQADGFQAVKVTSRDNKQQGILLEKSVRGQFTGNTATNNGESGIFLANSMDTEGGALDTKGAQVKDNTLNGNRFGLTLRRVRNLSVEQNKIGANCGGIFVVGDEGVPRGGALTVSHNTVTKNNKYCPASTRLPFIQGTGILLTGVEKTVVKDNDVRDNSGKSPMSGGIVLFKSVVGKASTGNTIQNNTVRGNKPADLANRDTAGTGNTFADNQSDTSEPRELQAMH